MNNNMLEPLQVRIGNDLILNVESDVDKENIYMYIDLEGKRYISIQRTINGKDDITCYSFFENFNRLIERYNCPTLVDIFSCTHHRDTIQIETDYGSKSNLGYCFEIVDIELRSDSHVIDTIRNDISKLDKKLAKCLDLMNS